MSSGNTKITFSVEIDEDIYNSIQDFLVLHRKWDFDRTVEAGMSLFLLQNYQNFRQLDHKGYRSCTRSYAGYICDRDDRFDRN